MKNYFLFLLLFTASLSAQTFWGLLPNFPGTPRASASIFMIGDTVYAGAGRDSISANQILTKDFYKYNPVTNTWTAIADIPGERWMANGFSIGNKGYVVVGGANGGLNDLWEYDPSNNSWAAKAPFPGGGRWSCFCFVINGKAYVGGGLNSPDYSDMWEYDPGNDQWTQKASFVNARHSMVGFSINNKGYVGLGRGGNTFYDDFWMYDPTLDTWTQKASFPDTTRYIATGFAVNNKGYIGLGMLMGSTGGYEQNDFWEYNPINDTWWSIMDVPGTKRYHCVATSNGNIAYILGGFNFNFGFMNDFYKYPYFVPAGIGQLAGNDLLSIISYKKHLTVRIKTKNDISFLISDMTGKILYDQSLSDSQKIDLSSISDQILVYRAITHDGKMTTGKFFLRD